MRFQRSVKVPEGDLQQTIALQNDINTFQKKHILSSINFSTASEGRGRAKSNKETLRLNKVFYYVGGSSFSKFITSTIESKAWNWKRKFFRDFRLTIKMSPSFTPP